MSRKKRNRELPFVTANNVATQKDRKVILRKLLVSEDQRLGKIEVIGVTQKPSVKAPPLKLELDDDGRTTLMDALSFEGIRCPVCGSADISAGSVDIEPSTAFQTAWCLVPDCRARWREGYYLAQRLILESGVSMVKE